MISSEKLEIRNKQSGPQPLTPSPHQIIRLTAFVIIVLGLGLRLYYLAAESLWYDELLQLDIAQGPLATILPQLPRHTAVPLDYLISHFWILLGRQDSWVRLPAVVFGTLTLPLAYQLGRTLLGRSEGLLLMALLAVSPFHVRYSQEVRPYALLVLGVVLASCALWRFRASGHRRYLVMLQVGVLIFALAHLFALVMFVPFLLWAAADFIFGLKRRQAARSLVALAGTGLVALVMLLAVGYGNTLFYSTREFGKAVVEPEKFTARAEQPAPRTGPPVNGFFVRNEILAPLGAGIYEPTLWLFNGLVGLGLLYLLTQKRYKFSLLLLLWLVIPPVVIVTFLVYRRTFFASRYIISTLPAYLVLLTAGLFALPRWLDENLRIVPFLRGRRLQGRREVLPWSTVYGLPSAIFLGGLGGLVVLALLAGLNNLYTEQKNENWRLISQFLAQNAQPNDGIMAVNAESTMNWYYPPAQAKVDSFDTLAAIQAKVAQSRRSWVIISVFSEYLDDELLKMKAWLGEQGAVRMVFDPVIDVYYLGPNTSPPQLLQEIQGMALPVDHALYASLARENRRNPAVAKRYYQLAIEHAPNEQTRAEYQAALEALGR